MKKSPEEIAEAMATKLRKTQEIAAAATTDTHIGKMALNILAQKNSVTTQDLIAAFEEDSAQGNPFDKIVADVCIKVLRPLQTVY